MDKIGLIIMYFFCCICHMTLLSKRDHVEGRSKQKDNPSTHRRTRISTLNAERDRRKEDVKVEADFGLAGSRSAVVVGRRILEDTKE